MRPTLVAVLATTGALLACTAGSLHDRRPTVDGSTMLSLRSPAPLSGCAFQVDGAPWPHGEGVPGEITPGVHQVFGALPDGTVCGDITIEVAPGEALSVSYFGP